MMMNDDVDDFDGMTSNGGLALVGISSFIVFPLVRIHSYTRRSQINSTEELRSGDTLDIFFSLLPLLFYNISLC